MSEHGEQQMRHITEPIANLRQYAAIKLRVPDSGCDWLDEMIRKSLRDQFAGQALSGLYDGQNFIVNYEGYARESYTMADAMLSERDKKCPK